MRSLPDQGCGWGGTPIFSAARVLSLSHEWLHLSDEYTFALFFFGAAFLTVSLRFHISKTKTARRIKTAKKNKRVVCASDPEPLHERALKCPSYRSLGDVGV